MKILYVQYANVGAYPAAMRAASLFEAAGHDIRFVALDHDRQAGLAVPVELASAISWVDAGRTAPLTFMQSLRRVLRDWRPDVLYVADCMAAMLAWPLLRRWDGKIVYHEHDSITEGAGLRQKLQWRARNALARRADAVVLPNAERAAFLAEAARLDRPPLTVWNVPLRREVEAVPAADPCNPDTVRLVYAGSINRQRVPLTLISALAQVASVELSLIGYETVSSRGYGDALRAEAARLGVADRLHLLGALPHSALITELSRHDVAFVALPIQSDDINHRHMVGASNKSFDALARGLALLVGPGNDWRATFVDRGLALACDPADAVSIAAAMHAFAADPQKARAMGAAGQQLIREQWNYETLFRPVLDMIGATATS